MECIVRGGTETNRERFADICNSRQSKIGNSSILDSQDMFSQDTFLPRHVSPKTRFSQDTFLSRHVSLTLLLLSNLPTTFTIFCAGQLIRQSFGFLLYGLVQRGF